MIDRSVVLPANASDRKAGRIGAWECCGLIDVSAQFGAAADELVMLTAVIVVLFRWLEKRVPSANRA